MHLNASVKIKRHMIKTLQLIILLSFAFEVTAQIEWKAAFNQSILEKANTGENAFYLNSKEKELLLLLNLARVAPENFNRSVYKPYLQEKGISKSSYTKSLERALSQLSALPPLMPHQGLTKVAESQAKDLNQSGKVSHYNSRGESPGKRIGKVGNFNMTAENIDFGNSTPLDILFNLLIDEGVKGVGHRKNLLHPNLTHIGVAIGPHPTYGVMCVQDFAANSTRTDETR